MQKLQHVEHPWRIVCTPADVMVLTMEVLGCTFISARKIVTRDQLELDLLCIAPKHVKMIAEEAAQQASDIE